MTLLWPENRLKLSRDKLFCELCMGAYIRRALKEEKLHALWKKTETA